ncbi:hypothetical protein G7Z17_g12654 [Cylindrodendrum hubeiense]|uniref:Uncharacterized protein n=1 Tax=Cylindrodendrum hubeiense TaxID=595255 RepID=A0A9P5GYH4_9HYPO|nr:hypothetical protein G7Z17_g12654 [Cylindrodendrum hubeiense]
MEYSVVNTPKARWQMDARHADGMTLPPWTRDESDHEDYDVTIMNDVARRNRRKIRSRSKRDESQEPPTNPNVQLSPPSSNSALRKRQSYDIPGNSLRESTAESYSQTATKAASTTASRDANEAGTSAAIDTATRTTAPYTAAETTAYAATPTANGDPYESGSESDGLSDSASESDYESDSAQDATVSSVPSSTADASLGGSGEPELLVTQESGLHSDVHKILLVVGSVVGLILILSVCLIAWKMRKRTRRRKAAPLDAMSFHKPSRTDKILAKLPFIRTRLKNREWYTIDEPTKFSYEKPPRFASRRIESQFFAPNKPVGVYSSPRMGSTRSKFTNADTVSPTSTMFVESTAVKAQVVTSQTAKEVRLSEQGKLMPTTPRYTYSHLKRQTGVSELSSISSGFGDGDIIITPNNTVNTIHSTTVPSLPSAVADPSRQSSMRSHATSRQSSMRSYGGGSRQLSMRSYRGDTRRDTASTDVSLDGRPRFHSVNSWVKQQSGHLRRAQRGADGDAPPVPMLPPPEQELRLMMPDGEEPRRVEMR